AGVGGGPAQTDGVHRLPLLEIDDDPLREGVAVLAGEGALEVRVALPERARVAVGEARVAVVLRPLVAGEAAAGERVAVGPPDRLPRRRAAGEVPAAGRVAPGPLRVPVPG